MFDDQTMDIVPGAITGEGNIEFPEPLQILFRPKRFKVLYGGRSAGRSWGVARALLLLGTQKTQRVLCTRELQKSIAESVHKVLSDQIGLLGLDSFWTIEKARIYGKNGSEFIFEGIKNNPTKIKSIEGIDICWVEEAENVSQESWEILTPTIRKKGSEIWITFNPNLAKDYTYQRFVVRPPEDSYVVKLSWRDNPWFSDQLRREMEEMKAEDYDRYLNIWEGFPRVTLQGAVFAKEIRNAIRDNRIGFVPWARDVPVDTFWDLGHRDLTAIWFVQRVAMQWRILSYFEDRGEDIHYYLRHCQTKPYTYGTFYLPHDAKHQRLGMKRSIEQIVRASGRTVRLVPKINKKLNAINAARMIFPSCWFDEKECAEGLDRLKQYSYLKKDGNFSDEPLHDDNSNGADAFMAIGQVMALGPGRGLDKNKLNKSGTRSLEAPSGGDWMAA